MSLKSLDREQISEMSMIEVAYQILKEEKTTFSYLDLLKRVAEVKEMTEEEQTEKIGYLYTHLNVDGRFVCIGDNVWGLKAWYPMEKLEEDIITQKPKKKAKAIDDEDELLEEDEFDELDDENEFDELEDELDEIAEEDDRDEFEEDDLDGFVDEEPDDVVLDDDDTDIID